jgi:hypothetical protein
VVFSGALAVVGEERSDVEVSVPAGGSVTFSEENNRLVATIDSAVNAFVRVPRTRTLEVDGGNGAICVEQLHASLDIQAGTAAIQAGIAPPSTGAVNLQTSIGGITLAVPDDTNADLTAQTPGGAVVFDGITFAGANVAGSASGDLNSGGGVDMVIQTTTANIVVRGR